MVVSTVHLQKMHIRMPSCNGSAMRLEQMSCMLKRPLETHFPSPDLGGGSWSCHGGEVLQGGDQTTRGEHAPGTDAACRRPYIHG